MRFRYNLHLRDQGRTFLGSSTAEHPAVNRRVVGSNPTRGARILRVRFGGLVFFSSAVPVEQSPHENCDLAFWVSLLLLTNPASCFVGNRRSAGVAELADAPDLGSGGQPP